MKLRLILVSAIAVLMTLGITGSAHADKECADIMLAAQRIPTICVQMP